MKRIPMKHRFTMTDALVGTASALLLAAVFSATVGAQNPSEESKRTECASVMKQLGTQFMLYADDFKVLPYVFKDTGKDPSRNCWNGLLFHAGYLKAESPHRLGAASMNCALLRCPGEAETKYPYHYGVNVFLAYTVGVEHSSNHRLANEACIRLGDVPDPGKRVYLADSRDVGTAGDIGNAFRHDGGESFNAYFLDGHINVFTKSSDYRSHDARVMFCKDVR